MWKIFNKLFGWNYVLIRDCGQYHICRVRLLPNGVLIGRLISRQFAIHPDGAITGGYGITEWFPITWEDNRATTEGES